MKIILMKLSDGCLCVSQYGCMTLQLDEEKPYVK